MKFETLCDAATAAAIDLPWLERALAPVGEPGRRAAERIEPYPPGAESAARARAERIAGLAARLDMQTIDAMREALRSAPDPQPALARIAMEGAPEDAHLLELLRFFEACARVDALGMDAFEPLLDDAARSVLRLLERGRAGRFGFYLDAAYDDALRAARDAAARAEAEFESARGRFAARAAAALGREELPPGEFIVMRDERAHLPAGIRVIREAPTYWLCELELDDAALRALERRDAAGVRVAEAEAAVRDRLAQEIRRNLGSLEAAMGSAGERDVELAAVRFCAQHACVVAEIAAEPEIAFEGASYLPLRAQLERDGRRYAPIAIDLRGVAVLTGPNMGGKSVALRTCAHIALLTAFGLPVPAASARCALFAEVAWLGIGSETEEALLSSFAREVVRLRGVLAGSTERTLLLVDEFARTTTPREGNALLGALLAVLRRRGRTALAATHLYGIAESAGVRHFAVRGLRHMPEIAGTGLREALEALAGAMDYAIVEVRDGEAGQSDAIALAALLGLDEEIVSEAKKAAWTR